VDGARDFLFVLVGVNVFQAVVAVAALVHGRSRRRQGEHQLARYSSRHAALLLVAAALLSIPLTLGLSGAMAPRTAAEIVVATELLGVLVGREISRRLHVQAHGSPGASAASSSSSATAATATAAEGSPEPTDA
jgi:hypothetical protein